jgi:hypothetical protein
VRWTALHVTGRRRTVLASFLAAGYPAGMPDDDTLTPATDAELVTALACVSAWKIDPLRRGIGVQNWTP